MTAPFGTPSAESLAALVLEVASQLHQERARRIALEEALITAGLLPETAITSNGDTARTRARTTEALTAAMAGLMRVMTERADPRAPLREDERSDPKGASA